MTYGSSSIQHQEKGHFAACSNRDFDFYYRGLEQGKLLIQKCSQCATLRNPPGPTCPACRSFAWEALPIGGGGTVFSYTVHHHPPLPGFATPHPIVLVDTDEGVRLVGAMDGADATVHIGMRVRVEFVRRGEVAAFRFCPAASPDTQAAPARG
jgi:uncharacterized OB-fold protein